MATEEDIAIFVRNFITENKIHCPEVTVSDRVYVNAPDFIHELCELVGYYEYEENE